MMGLLGYLGLSVSDVREERLMSADDTVATNSKGQTEAFWGVDHMGQLCDHLGLERPKTKGWRALL